MEKSLGIAHDFLNRNKREKPYSCHRCEKTFCFSIDLTKHQRFHTGEKSHQCNNCRKTYQKSSLITHQKVHTGSHMDSSWKSLYQPSSLIVHQRIHTGEKSYKCNDCGKAFCKSSNLISHTKYTHQRERPCACVWCEKICLSRNITKHQAVHTGEMPY